MTKANITFAILDGVFAVLNYCYLIYGQTQGKFYLGNLMAGIICTIGCFMQFV